VNGIRTIDVEASIAQDDLLSIGTDKFGIDQVLLGVLPISGSTLEFVEITNENWGNRLTNVPDFNDPVSGFAGYFIPPLFQVIQANSTTTIRARQTAVGAETERCLLKFMIADNQGNYPAWVADHIGQLHTQFGEGTATNGSLPGKSSPTFAQNVLNEMPNDTWMPLLGAAIGDTPGRVAFGHPFDEGFPPEIQTVGSTGLGGSMFQPIAPTNPFRGADEMQYLAEDDSGSAVDMWLYTGRITGGMAAVSNYTSLAV